MLTVWFAGGVDVREDTEQLSKGQRYFPAS
jgi:hypothetical protein